MVPIIPFMSLLNIVSTLSGGMSSTVRARRQCYNCVIENNIIALRNYNVVATLINYGNNTYNNLNYTYNDEFDILFTNCTSMNAKLHLSSEICTKPSPLYSCRVAKRIAYEYYVSLINDIKTIIFTYNPNDTVAMRGFAVSSGTYYVITNMFLSLFFFALCIFNI